MAVTLQTAWAQGNTGLFDNWTETDYSEYEITHEYFTPGGIAKSGSGGYDMTGYIPVKGGDVIVFSGDRSPGIPFMMGYADNQGGGATVLLGDFDANNWNDLQVREREVPIPAGTAYVRCSARNTSLPNWAGRNMTVIKRSQTEEQRTIRILAIGNSYSGDMIESWLSPMARESGIQLVIGIAVYGGYGPREHWKDLVDGVVKTEYRKIANGTYSLTPNHTLTELISDEPWDIITFQQNSQNSGLYETYTPYLQNLIDYVKGFRPEAKLGWLMTWAYAGDAPQAGFSNYNRDQMTMFNAIVDATTQVMHDHPDLEFMVPCGTAIQNLRSSYVGDNVNRDGGHLDLSFGRLTTAYTVYATLFGEEATLQNTYHPYFQMSTHTMSLVRKAALDAVRNPYVITPQDYPDYVGESTIVPADIQFNFTAETKTEIQGWNNIGPFYELTAGFKDVNGKDPGIFVWCDHEFSSATSVGPPVTSTSLNMPAEVSSTAVYGYSEGDFYEQPHVPTNTIHFHHLNKSLSYDFTFFASRGSTDNLETEFLIQGGAETSSAIMDAASNTGNTVTLSDVKPDENGIITLTVQAGPGNNNQHKFYYLNALRISVHREGHVPDFALNGNERPIVGDSLSVSSNGDLSGYAFRWTKGDALGTFDDTILSSTKDYVITESDHEHWLRVTVNDNTGNTVFTEKIWISKLPVLYIDTEDGNPITSKTDYVPANLRIQGNAEFEQQYMGKTEIRGRGNSSWVKYPQKPYKLKLDKKTKLFGFGKSKHWVLISNFNDETCLRNYIASKLAKQLGLLSMDMTWVDVVLNGEVKGCYMLSQHIRVDKNSVNIFDWEGEAEDVADALFDVVKDVDALEEGDKNLLEETMKQNLAWITDGMVTFKAKTYNLSDYGLKKEYDITKGYLFEASQKTSKTHFVTPQNVNFEVSAPEYLSSNNSMMSYVTNLWKDFEAEYCRVPTVGGKNFSKYADMSSMVGIWLVNEIMGQSDLINSRYCYIADDGKIHFGPAWDYDHAGACISTTRKMNFFYTFADWTTPENLLEQIYYDEWFPDPFLCQMAYDAYWNVARPFIMDCVSEGGEIDARFALFAEAAQTNDILWGDYPPPTPSAIVRTAAEDIEYFRTFLLRHTNWLGEQFQSIKGMAEVMNEECTYPCDPKIIEDGIGEVKSGKGKDARKVILDKHLYIIRDGKTYSIDGKRIE